MANNNERSAAEALREQLEHLELQQQNIEQPRTHLDIGATRRSNQPSPAASRTSLHLSAASPGVGSRVRFSLESPSINSQPQTPAGGLYTIESHARASSSRQPGHRRMGSTIHEDSASQEPSGPRISLTRPRQLYDNLQGTVHNAIASADEPSDALAQYRDWVGRQKKKKTKLTNLTSRPWKRIRKEAQTAYKKYILEGVLRQRPIPPSKDGRHIPLRPGLARRKPLGDERTGKHYISNFIRSSRYTVWDFLPKQLFFQFSKLANFYFLVIGILQMIPGLSTTGKYTTIAPLMAFVCLSMAKEGYDDYRRYRLDKSENRSVAWVLDPEGKGGGRSTRLRQDLKGVFSSKKKEAGASDPELRAVELEEVPSGVSEQAPWVKVEWQDIRVGDIVQLRRDDNVPADMVLLHATGPNGIAYIETMALDGETNLKSKQACPLLAEHCETVAGMSACDAEVVSEDPNLDLYNYEGRVTVNGKTMPLTMNQVVYRGSTLRNTAKAFGLVVNTGEECKIRMNAHKNAHAKAPEMQFMVNRIVILLVFFVLALSTGCMGGYIMWRDDYEDYAWYLKGKSVPLREIVIGFIIAFNTLIPLSLYVSLEIVKLGQLFLLSDIEMYDPNTDTPMVANTTTILENLGQVSYVFSDKTGTLTENMMKFRKISVAGTAWLHDMDLQKEAAENERTKNSPTRVPTKGKGEQEKPAPNPALKALSAGLQDADNTPIRTSTSHWKSPAGLRPTQPELKTEDLIRYLQHRPHSPFSRMARQFILCVALCHTCLPEPSEDGEISFQAASPDELALVEGARDLGYLLIDRPAQSIKLQTVDADGNPVTESYEVLDVIEFSSKRKRMSIVIRMPDGRICIFTKGADSMILPRLKQSNLAIQTATAVEKRASMRKSMEQEKALRRLSVQSIKRESMTLVRAASTINHMNARKGTVRTSTSFLTDEVDSWLSRREQENVDGEGGTQPMPRRSMTRGRSIDAVRQYDSWDGMIDESLARNEAAVFERCFQHIDDFASEGLRTLVFAYRYLDEDEYKKWKAIYHEATTSLVDRQERIEAAAELIEQGFDLAGATAIEDKLQEGVPETIDKFRRANIKVWMLTGDKRETAINIAHSARICKPFSEVYILDATQGRLQDKLASTLIDVGRGMIPHSVVVIDGHTLSVVEEDESLRVLFFDLVARVDSVICCRASPSQKATLVKCIRRQVPSSVTLAIGDGANDIAMIQASHVGIGISGREGLQAARISDYSIAQFRFLQRLLFVHGRWNYIRTAKYILGTFWKEVVFYLVQAQYQHYNGYTGTSIFESTSLTVFNTLFTSLPVILPGIFDKDLSADTLMSVPELYTYGQKSKGFNVKNYIGWMFMAVAESVIIFNASYHIYGVSILSDDDAGLYALGTLAFTLCVIFINIKLFLIECHNRTAVIISGLLISCTGWFVWNLFLSGIFSRTPGPYVVKDAFIEGFGRNALWWLTAFIILCALIIFELAVVMVRRSLWPTDQDLMKEVEHIDGVMDVMKEHAAERGEIVGQADEDDDDDAGGISTMKNKKSVDVTSIQTADSVPSSVGVLPGGHVPGWGRKGAGAGAAAGRPSPLNTNASGHNDASRRSIGNSVGGRPSGTYFTQNPIELQSSPPVAAPPAVSSKWSKLKPDGPSTT